MCNKKLKFHKPQYINLRNLKYKNHHHRNFINPKNHPKSFHLCHHNPLRILRIIPHHVSNTLKPTHHNCFKSGFAVSSSSTKPNSPIIKTKTHLKASTYKQLNSFNFPKASTFTTFFTQSHSFFIWVFFIFF